MAALALLGGAGFLQAADADKTSQPAANASALSAHDSYKHVFDEPFWTSTKMECEPVFFVKDTGREFATAKLLFVPTATPVLRSPDLATAYEPGKDFTWKSGSNVIELLKDSRIPFKTVEEMRPPKGTKNSLGGVLWSEGHFFHDLQPQASYEHAGSWTWQPTASTHKLTRSLTKLKDKRAFKVVAIGDSITEGYNASGFKKIAVPPRQPAYPELLALLLERHFGSAVSLKNLGIAGTKADRAFTQLEQLKSEQPDLVTIAYGMNHAEPPEAFEAAMRKLLAAVQEAVPNADVVLVSSMTGRLPATKFVGYRDVLLKMAGDNVAVADVTTPWIELLKTKSFTDISGNNINHPNDFGHRLYASVIFQVFTTSAPREVLPPQPKPPVTPAAPAADAKAANARREKATLLLKDMKIPEGFDASIFATSAEANYPVFVAATADGTLFVSSDGNGSLGRDPGRGRILRLRDTDGDGAADDVKTFAADVDSPRGLVWVDDRLIVLHPPHVSSFRDTDGDGVADERSLLIRGIAFDYSKRPADHTSNGLALGIDGWVYAAIGDFGFMEAVGVDDRKLQLRGGGLVRFRPDGTGIDLFARGTRNNLEAAVGPLLDMITRDNTNDGGGWNVRLHAFTGLEDHGYPRRYMHFADEIVTPLADYGGGSGTGACWIDEPWMPAPLNDAAFTCDWGRGHIYRHRVTEKAAGYEATQEDFLGIQRATDVDVDAVGHLYAASWRNGTFSWTGPDVGFIARLTPKNAKPVAVPHFKKANVPELVATLAGPSLRLRLESQRAMLSRGLVQQAADDLEKIVASAAASRPARVAAVFTLALGRQAEAIPALVKLSADPAIAAWAVRALGDLAGEGVTVSPEPVHAALASADARTRKEAVVATVRLATAESAAKLVPLTADADPVVAHTAVEGLVRLAASREADVIAACSRMLHDAGTPPAVHRAAARVLGEIHSEASADAVLTRLNAASEATQRGDLAWAAARLWQRESAWKGESWGTRPDTRGPYYAPERWSASDRLEGELLDLAKKVPPAELPGLARTLGLHRLPAEIVATAFFARDGGTSAAVTFLDVAGVTPPRGAISPLAAIATDPQVATAARLEAIRVLARADKSEAVGPLCDAVVALEAAGGSGADVALARSLVRESTAVLVDLAALEQVAAKGAEHAALVDDALLCVAGSSVAKGAVRGQAAARLADDWKSSPDRRAALVAASLRTGSKVLATSLVAAADQGADQPLREAATTAIAKLGINPQRVREVFADTGPKVDARPVAQVIKLVDETRGDRAIGMELFVAKKCVSCHAAGVDSAGLGPSLANAAGIYNRKQLTEAVLLPNKSIAQGFATTVLILDDGRQCQGFVTSEGADRLTLRDAQGVEHAVDKKTIEDRAKLPTSIMPEGLVADLTIGQLASLIDFVESIGK